MAFSKSAVDEVLAVRVSELKNMYERVRDYLWKSASQSSATAASLFNDVVAGVSQLDDVFTALALVNIDVLSVTCAGFAHTTTATATVTLTVAAPPGGATVLLASTDVGVFTVPSSVAVSASATTATFTVTGVAAGTADINAAVGSDVAVSATVIVS